MVRLTTTTYFPFRCTSAVLFILAICHCCRIAVAFVAPDGAKPTTSFRCDPCQQLTTPFASSDDGDSGDTSSSSQCNNNASNSSLDRRKAFARATTTIFAAASLPVSVASSPALALKEKNEALCGTGFFEHIYEYKCTSIGDIEDEGVSKSMSQVENGLTDSLMGKLGFDSGDITDGYDQKSKKNSDAKPKQEKLVGAGNKQ